MLILQGLIFAILVFIAWQDFKFRAVYWWLFVFLLIALTGLKMMKGNWQDSLLYDLKCNVMFLGIQLLFLTGYFSIKEKKMVNIFSGYFGLGDVFFLLSITTHFSFFNYVIYYLISLFVVILISMVIFCVKRSNLKIPLAGEQALLLILFMLIDSLVEKVNLTSDLGLIKYFNL